MRSLIVVLTLISGMFLGGCATVHSVDSGDLAKRLMPSTTRVTTGGTNWQGYADADSDYGSIVIGRTTVQDLNALGIPIGEKEGTNIRTVPREAVLARLIPSGSNGIKLTPEMEACKDYTATPCIGYEVRASGYQKKGSGSFILRAIKYRTTDTVSEWNVMLFVVIRNNAVIYASIDGTSAPNVWVEDRKTPLKPLGSIVGGVGSD